MAKTTRSRKTQNTNATRTAIGYVRVSTAGQAQDGVSLDAQRHAIEVYCRMAGLQLAGIEADEGISGSRAANRPGLQRAMDAACKTGGVLVVYALSRLARNTIETLELAGRLEAADADLASLSERIDSSGACGRMIFRMLSVLAEFERDQVAERTVAGLAEKRRRGEKLGGRHAPYGYDAEDRDGVLVLVPNEREQAAIAMAKQLRDAGESLRAIGEKLHAAGYASKSGGAWHAKTVGSLLAA